MASPQQTSNTPETIRDLYSTPDFLYHWADKRFHFSIDLAAGVDNRKCSDYYCEDDNALIIDWQRDAEISGIHGAGWCNPPYSGAGAWLKKGWQEAQKGFCSVFLVPTPNGESYYGDHVFGKASEIIFINGRISFIAADDFLIKGKNGRPDKLVRKGDSVNGNNRGSCLIVYARRYEGHTNISWVNRDDMIAEYEQLQGGNNGTN